MSKLNVMLFAAGLTSFVAASVGHTQSETPEWAAVCAHLGGLMGMEVTDEVCAEMQSEGINECGDNIEATMRCILAADDDASFDLCGEICEGEAAPAAPEWAAVCAHLCGLMTLEVSDEICDELDRALNDRCGDNLDEARRCITAAMGEADLNACQEVCDGEPTIQAQSTVEWAVVCAHVGELMAMEVNEEMCREMENALMGECRGNVALTTACMMAATDMGAFEACEVVCEGPGGSPN